MLAAIDEALGVIPLISDGLNALERFCCKFAWALELREARWPHDHADALPMLDAIDSSRLTPLLVCAAAPE